MERSIDARKGNRDGLERKSDDVSRFLPFFSSCTANALQSSHKLQHEYRKGLGTSLGRNVSVAAEGSRSGINEAVCLNAGVVFR